MYTNKNNNDDKIKWNNLKEQYLKDKGDNLNLVLILNNDDANITDNIDLKSCEVDEDPKGENIDYINDNISGMDDVLYKGKQYIAPLPKYKHKMRFGQTKNISFI